MCDNPQVFHHGTLDIIKEYRWIVYMSDMFARYCFNSELFSEFISFGWQPVENVKMSSGFVLSPGHPVSKTRNAILRMKKCSPELRAALRQRCQQRIQNDRLDILNTFRKITIQERFKVAFGNILKEELKNIDDEFSDVPLENIPPDLPDEFNLDVKIWLEELLEKEMLLEHEDWLIQLYEEFLTGDLEESNEVVCPLCCLGYLKQVECDPFKRTSCTKCPGYFSVEKSLTDLQSAIYESLARHDKQCDSASSFVNVPKNETENNLCIVCHHCSYLEIIE